MFKEKNHKLYICSIVLLVMLVQFVDSYCAELYSKMQSFVVRDYIIKGTELKIRIYDAALLYYSCFVAYGKNICRQIWKEKSNFNQWYRFNFGMPYVWKSIKYKTFSDW